MSQQINEEIEMSVFGVPGRLVRTGNHTRKPGCWMTQKWTSERRAKNMQGENLLVHAEIRFDDNCGNGHNSFAITGFGWNDTAHKRGWDFCGCIHEIIEFVFPELKHLIKWHLVDTSGPMHYVANTVYHASNRDHRGKLKGEPYAWKDGIRFGNSPITVPLNYHFANWLREVLQFRETTPKSNPNRPSLDIVEVPYTGKEYKFDPHYTLGEYGGGKWHDAPFRTLKEAEEFSHALLLSYVFVKQESAWSEGKERDLDAARSCANWPEATDEQLMLPAAELTKLLEARLPPLLTEFRADVEAAGFLWERPE